MFRTLLEADLRHLVVMVDIAITACKEDLVRSRDPHRRLVREREGWVGSDRTDGRARAEDLQEVLVEDLEERRGSVRRVEELRNGRLPEGPVVAEHRKRARIDELRSMQDDDQRAAILPGGRQEHCKSEV